MSNLTRSVTVYCKCDIKGKRYANVSIFYPSKYKDTMQLHSTAKQIGLKNIPKGKYKLTYKLNMKDGEFVVTHHGGFMRYASWEKQQNDPNYCDVAGSACFMPISWYQGVRFDRIVKKIQGGKNGQRSVR